MLPNGNVNRHLKAFIVEKHHSLNNRSDESLMDVEGVDGYFVNKTIFN